MYIFLSLLTLSTFSFAYYYFGSCLRKQWKKNLFYLLSCWCYFHRCVVATFVIVLLLFSPLCYYFCCLLVLLTCCMVLPTCYYWFQCVVATSIVLLVFLTYWYYFHCVIGAFVMLLLLPFICTCLCPCSFFVLLFLSCS